MTATHPTAAVVLSPERAANLAENPFAGQGPVLLDIGGDVGAIVLHLPASMEGAEIAIVRVDDGPDTTTRFVTQPLAVDHAAMPDHHHAGAHHHHEHHAELGHAHVAVVARPTPAGVRHSAVFPGLVAGVYELGQHTGDLRLRVEVAGGSVTDATWPGVVLPA